MVLFLNVKGKIDSWKSVKCVHCQGLNAVEHEMVFHSQIS